MAVISLHTYDERAAAKSTTPPKRPLGPPRSVKTPGHYRTENSTRCHDPSREGYPPRGGRYVPYGERAMVFSPGAGRPAAITIQPPKLVELGPAPYVPARGQAYSVRTTARLSACPKSVEDHRRRTE